MDLLLRTSLDWTTQAHSDLSLLNVAAMLSSLIPLLQSSTNIVRNPSSLAWNAVEPSQRKIFFNLTILTYQHKHQLLFHKHTRRTLPPP